MNLADDDEDGGSRHPETCRDLVSSVLGICKPLVNQVDWRIIILSGLIDEIDCERALVLETRDPELHMSLVSCLLLRAGGCCGMPEYVECGGWPDIMVFEGALLTFIYDIGRELWCDPRHQSSEIVVYNIAAKLKIVSQSRQK